VTEPIARIEAALAQLGDEHEPPAGWEARVLAATGARRRRPWWHFAAPGIVLAAAAVAVYLAIPPHRNTALALRLTYDKAATVVRGDTHQIGEVVHATATGGDRYRAVWIYRDETELVAACPGSASCRTSDDVMVAEVTLALVGTYTIVALASSAPLAPPTGSYDADLGRARSAGVTETEVQLAVQ